MKILKIGIQKIYINIFKSGNKLHLIDNNITIDQNVYIPSGLGHNEPGQSLYIINDVFIISNSAWTIGGEGPLTLISGKKIT